MSSKAEGKKPQKSLFNKPKWGAPKTITSETDLFSRSNRSYESFKLDEEERRRKKAERKLQEKSRESQVENSTREEKRRRLSNYNGESQDKAKDVQENSGRENKQEACEDEKTATPNDEPVKSRQSPESLSERYETSVTQLNGKISKSKSAVAVDLGEDESNSVISPKDEDQVVVTQLQPTKKEEEEDPMPSDEEFPELARKAREQARRKRLESEKPDISSSSQSQSYSFGAGRLSSNLADDSQVRSSKSAEPAPAPVVNLLVTSNIPNTTPVIVRRKLTQRLKEVRLAWCGRQGFDESTIMGVFLTWRGMRVFDVNSCKALGIGVDEDDNVVMDGEKDALGERERRIHMEVMTHEMFEEYKKAKLHAARQQYAEQDETIEEAPPPEEKSEAEVRIVVRAKDLPDHKLIVRPVSISANHFRGFLSANEKFQNTKMAKLLKVFRLQYQLPEERTVTLMFDGERLDPETTIEQADIGDMDTIEAYVK